jgi:hypothetical protein
VPDSKGQASAEQENFMFSNYASLAKEMAQGTGTTLAGLANVMGCGEQHHAAFFKAAQTDHEKIFSSPGALAALDTLKETISNNTTLAQNCTLASLSTTEGVK